MAISTSETRELDIARIITLAYQRAGLVHLSQATDSDQELFGSDSLEVITDYLVTEGAFVRNVDFYELTTVNGTSEYTMPANMLDILDTATYLPAGQTTGESYLTKINRDRWIRINNKTATGQPNLYYSHRKAAIITVRLWPVPDEAGKVTFQYHKLSADTNDTTKTPEAGRHWNDYFIWRLAHDMATAAGQPVQRLGYLWSRAERMLAKAKDYSNEAYVDQMIHAHSSGYTWGSR